MTTKATSAVGVDMAGAVAHARDVGGPALRALTFHSRGQLLQQVSRALHQHRDELLGLAMANGGNTRGDAKFDVDGAIGTLAAYGEIGVKLGECNELRDGEGAAPTRSSKLWGEHLFFVRPGVAVHINAFNFPAWGLCEKAAVAWLAGAPVISKPATSTAVVACRIVELLAQAQVLPRGALQLVAGGVGDLLEHLGGEDVLAFTGSSDTAQVLRRSSAVTARGTRLNVEADSLNAAALGPDGLDGATGSELYDLFLADVVRDITQKTGQKCTAIRRIFVPRERLADVAADLTDRLSALRVGDPADEAVQMGPVATVAQLQSVRAGIGLLQAGAGVRLLCGGAEAPALHAGERGRGYFVAPTLLLCEQPLAAGQPCHQHEVFGPVATLMPYGSAAELVQLLRLGGGSLVASLYSDDRALIPQVVRGAASSHGRIFLGSARLGGSPGPGTVLPLMNHGGPGHAGDGQELGGVRGLQLYMQRCAVMGYRPTVEGLLPGAAARV